MLELLEVVSWLSVAAVTAAQQLGRPAAVRSLLSLGADRSIKDGDDNTAEEAAKPFATKSVFSEIPEEGQDELMTRAVREEDWATAAVLVKRGASIDNIEEEKRKKIFNSES